MLVGATRITTLLVAIVLLISHAHAGPVRLVERADGHQLLVDGEPFFVQGAGGQSHLDQLVAAGGNSIRTWGADNAQEVLDAAHERGIKVTLGIWLGHERHGFDYNDPQQVRAQLDKVRRIVRQYKDHPALLMWGLGNEIALEGDPRRLFPEVERVARLVKSIDTDHPTMTVIAGASERKISAFMDRCPSVDILGVNSYGGAADIPSDLARHGYEGPYMVTEFGPRGWWESPAAPWGAEIEPTSAEKAEMYRRGYEGGVLGAPGRCLGCYVFLWGQKQEATATWFGMFLRDGSKTPTVDVFHRFWSGEAPDNHAPVVSAIESPVSLAGIAPGTPFTASVEVSDADGDALEPEWVIIAESTDRKTGGDAEEAPPEFPELTMRQRLQGAELVAPKEEGPYRLFITVRDGEGGAGTANIPFFVIRRAEDAMDR